MKLADDIATTVGLERWIKYNPACMIYLFHARNPKNSVDSDGESALLYSIKRKEPEVLNNISIPPQALIEAGADVNVGNLKGTTPLMAAAKKGDADLIRDLLAHGADPKAKDKNGRRALDLTHSAELRAMLS